MQRQQQQQRAAREEIFCDKILHTWAHTALKLEYLWGYVQDNIERLTEMGKGVDSSGFLRNRCKVALEELHTHHSQLEILLGTVRQSQRYLEEYQKQVDKTPEYSFELPSPQPRMGVASRLSAAGIESNGNHQVGRPPRINLSTLPTPPLEPPLQPAFVRSLSQASLTSDTDEYEEASTSTSTYGLTTGTESLV